MEDSVRVGVRDFQETGGGGLGGEVVPGHAIHCLCPRSVSIHDWAVVSWREGGREGGREGRGGYRFGL